jgi:CRISPR-associated endonuclease/helicase Cas3
MATANAMFRRTAEIHERLYSCPASLTLTHGARDLVYARDEWNASTTCAAWIADSRKKSLLAQTGVGTIDQALLAVLYARHQSLRLLGLLHKVLIVDEVHAYDHYMNSLLQTLLTFHAAAGGSAILLSATLPQGMRTKLVAAWCRGLAAETPELTSNAYPLLTHVAGCGSVREEPVATRAGSTRRVQVRLLSTPDEAIQRIVAESDAGHCVCWILNTVADARRAYASLQTRLPADRLMLFHARYAMGDRLDIENEVLTCFGKESGAEQRRGRVLVATQVVEQSLDLDFDVLISDLAPMDLLIQRAGRLCRHRRDATGRTVTDPTAGPDPRGIPCLYLHGPDPDGPISKDWYETPFPGAAHVYPDHARLWRTARLLKDRGGIAMPDDARLLIEGVYGEEVVAAPAALEASAIRAQGAGQAHQSQAHFNSINLADGYNRASSGFDWWEDATTPTRLGDVETSLRLARWEEDILKPWREDGTSPQACWELSQVKLRGQYEIAEPEAPAQAAALPQLLDALPDRGRFSVVVLLTPDGTGRWMGAVRNKNATQAIRLYYNGALGLLTQTEMESLDPTDR